MVKMRCHPKEAESVEGRLHSNLVSWTYVGAIILLLAVSCTPTTINGSGRVVTKVIPVSSFTKIEVDDAFDVNVSLGSPERVTIHVDDNLVDRLDVGASDGKLRLAMKSRTSVRDATLHADVTTRSLSEIDVSAAGNVYLADELTGRTLSVTLSGASRLDGTVGVDEANVELAGASNATLAGSAQRLTVTGSGASDLEAERLQSGELVIDLSGASSVTASVIDTISAVLSGASSLRYRGTPRFSRKELSGGSSITPL